MSKSFSKLKNKMSPEALKAVEKKKESLIKEMLLFEIREQQDMTQEELASKLNTKQANISRTERRSDIKISTLKRHIEGMGGELDIVAKFPDHEIHLKTNEI